MSAKYHITRPWLADTYRLRRVHHADIEVPQADPAVRTHTAKPVISLVASPRIKSNGRDPRLMALASCYEYRF